MEHKQKNMFTTTAKIREEEIHIPSYDFLNKMQDLLNEKIDVRKYSKEVRGISVFFSTKDTKVWQEYKRGVFTHRVYKPISSFMSEDFALAYLEAISQINSPLIATESLVEDVERLFEENGLVVRVV